MSGGNPNWIEMWQEDFFENGTIGWYTALVEGEVLEMAGWMHARVESRLEMILDGEMIDHARIRFAEALVHGPFHEPSHDATRDVRMPGTCAMRCGAARRSRRERQERLRPASAVRAGTRLDFPRAPC